MKNKIMPSIGETEGIVNPAYDDKSLESGEVGENGDDTKAVKFEVLDDSESKKTHLKQKLTPGVALTLPSPVLSSETETSREKLSIWKNIIVISISFTFLFTSYNSAANLQSSLYRELGTVSLSSVYVGLVFSCFLIPSLMIDKFKEKFTMVISVLGFSAFSAAQFLPLYYTMVPAAILAGLGAAPMWSAQCTYFTTVGKRFADLSSESSTVVITKFFGVFFLFYQSTQIFGNLISSTILAKEPQIMNSNDSKLEYCGKDFFLGASMNVTSSSDDVIVDQTVTDSQLYIMATVYLSLSLLSPLIILCFLDPLERYKVTEEVDKKTSTQLLAATFHQMKNPYQILMIPLTAWSGLQQAFIFADFTAAFVSCGYGVHLVGDVMIVYGVCDAIFSVLCSRLVRQFGRVPVLTTAAILNISLLAFALFWKPTPESPFLFFLFAGLWGIGDAVWQTQLNSFYGVIFPGESKAAYSNYRLWESGGLIWAYLCSTLIYVGTKTYLLIGFLCIGISGYYTVEVMEKRKQKLQK